MKNNKTECKNGTSIQMLNENWRNCIYTTPEEYEEELFNAIVEGINNGECNELESWYDYYYDKTNKTYVVYLNEHREKAIRMAYAKIEGIAYENCKELDLKIATTKLYEKLKESKEKNTKANSNRVDCTENNDGYFVMGGSGRESSNDVLQSQLEKDLAEANITIQKQEDRINELENEKKESNNEVENLKEELKRLENNIKEQIEKRVAQKLEEQKAEFNKQAIEEAQNYYNQTLKGYFYEYIKDIRESRADSISDSSSDYAETAAIVSKKISESCNGASEVQRNMQNLLNEYKSYTATMDTYMLEMGARMDEWRNSLYKIQLEGFAKWYISFCTYVDSMDATLCNTTTTIEDKISQIKKGFTLRRDNLEKILPAMRLQVYAAKKGDHFNIGLHETDLGVNIYEGIINACIRPGVKLIGASEDLDQVLVKAEVELEK